MLKKRQHLKQPHCDNCRHGAKPNWKVNHQMNILTSSLMKPIFFTFLMALACFSYGQTEFITTWKTDNVGTSGDTEITVPMEVTTGTYAVDWDNDGAADESGLTGSVTHDFGSAGTYTIRIIATSVDRMNINFNNGGDRLKILDISQWGDIRWTTFTSAYYGCENLDISASDAPELTNFNSSMNNAFRDCSSLTGGLSNWPVTSISTMVGTFQGCTQYSEDLSGWVTTNLRFMQDTFRGSAFNGDITSWDVSFVESFWGAFQSNTAFNQDISGWTIRASGKLMNFINMFNGASSFDQNLANWDMSNLWEASNMLSNSGMSTANYDATLLGWSGQTFIFEGSGAPRTGFQAFGIRYCDNTGRSDLINNHGWALADGGPENDPPVPDAASLSDLNDACQINSLTAPTATDDCSGAIVATHDQTLPITATTTITWTYTDGNGNEATQMQNVIIADNIAPVPDNGSLAALNAACSVSALTAPTATDNCSGAVTGSHDQTLPIVASTTITWTFTDANGNETTQNQNVIIADSEVPVPDAMTLSELVDCTEVMTLTAPTATDNCKGSVVGTHDATLPINTPGNTLVTWTFVDDNGNSNSQTQNVFIGDVTDPVPDAASLSDINQECPLVSLTPPTATDNCSGAITATHNITLPITFIGTTVVTWTYDDGNGNTVTQDQNVILTDNTAPVPDVATLADIVSLADVTSLTTPTATDGCQGSIIGTHDATLPLTRGMYTITWTYDDGNGNSSQQTQDAFVGDLTAPVITLTGATSVSVEAGSSYTDEGATALDDVDGDLSASIVTINPVNINVPDIYTVTYNVSDAAGNDAIEETRTVTVEDTNAPVITLTGSANVFLFTGESYADAGATSTDSFDGDLTSGLVINNPVDINTPGIYSVTYNVSDAAGNAAMEVTRTVEVASLSAPALNFVGNLGLDYDYIEIPDNPSLDFTTALTFETWINFNDPIVRFDNGYDWQCIFAKSRFNESYGLMLVREPAGGNHILRFYHTGFGSGFTDYSWPVNANTWYHMAVTFDDSKTSIYVDGVEVSSQTATGSLNANNNPLRIGAAPTGVGDPNNILDPYPLDASLDEVRLWNVARNVTEINAEKDSELKGDETGLVLYYNFNEGMIGEDNTSITSVQDKSLQGNDGTPSGFLLTGNAGNFVSSSAANIATPFDNQEITFGALVDMTFGDSDFFVSATASSSLPITSYTSSNPAVATITGSNVTIVGAGTTDITAFQSGDATTRHAEATQTLTVNPFGTTIDLNLPGINPVYSGSPHGISSSSNDINGSPALILVTEYSESGANVFSTTVPSNAGIYDVRANLDVAETNYSAPEATGTLTIDKVILQVKGQTVQIPVNSASLPPIPVEYRGFLNADGTDGDTDISGLPGAVDLGTIATTVPTVDLNTVGNYDIQVDVGTATTTNYQLTSDATLGQVIVADNQPVINVTDTLKVQVEPGGQVVGDLSINNDGAFGNLIWSAAISDTLGHGYEVTFNKSNFASWQLPANQDRITDNVFITRGDNRSIFNARTETTSSNSVSPADTEWFRGGANMATSFASFHTMHGGNPGSLVGDTATIHLISDDQFHEIAFSTYSGGNTGGGFGYTRTPMHDYITVSGVSSGNVGSFSSANTQFTFDATHLKPGLNYGTITLTTNDPVNPTVTVVTELEVLPAPVFEITETIVGDTVTIADPATMKTFKIRNTGSSELTWSTTTSGRPFQMNLVNFDAVSGTIPAGGETTITVNFDMTTFGYYEWPVTFTTNDPINPGPMMTVSVFSSGVPITNVVGNPTSLTLENTFVGYRSVYQLGFTNTGNDTLFVYNAASDQAGVTLQVDSLAILPFTSTQYLELLFEPTAATVINGNLTYTTNDPLQVSNTIPFMATALDAPVINVTPTTITETLTVNDTIKTQVTVSNTAGSDLIWQVATQGSRDSDPISFVRASGADPNLEANQDRISDNVWLTQASGFNQFSIFNIVEEASPSGSTATIEWATKPTAEAMATDYGAFPSFASFSNRVYSLHLIAEDRYFDIDFQSFSAFGGNMAYIRKEIIKWVGASISEQTDITNASGTNTVFDIELYGGAVFEGSFDGSFTISSNDPLATSLVLPINATVNGGTPNISTTNNVLNTAAVVNQSGNFSLEIINSGNGPLNVTDVTVDDPVFGIDLTAFTIAPFGSYILPLTFDPTLEQAYPATLTVTSNDPVNGTYDVALTGTGLPSATFDIPELIIYDTLAAGASNAKTFAIKNLAAGDLNWEFTSIFFEKPPHADFQAAANQDRISDKVWLTRADTKPVFNIVEHEFYHSNMTSVLWTGGVTSDLGTYDTYHDAIGDGSAMASNTYGIHLVEEDRYFDLDFITWSQNNTGGGVSYNRRETVPWLLFNSYSGTISGVGQTDLGVTFQANNLKGGDYEFSYDIKSNDPGNSVKTVTFKLHVTGTPDINVVLASDSVRFSNQNIGFTSITPITIQNTGDSTLSVSNIVFDDAVFGIEESMFAVPAGGERIVNVIFTPQAAVLYKAGFTITSNDPDESPLTFGVRGTGVPVPELTVDRTSIDLQISAGGLVSGDLQINNSALGTLDWNVESKYIVGTKDLAFTKSPGANWLEAGNYDEIADDIWLSREQSGKLINVYDNLFNVTPNPIFKWANGHTNVLGIDPNNYDSDMSNAFSSLRNLPGNTLSLYLEDHDRLFDVTFSQWSSGGGDYSQVPAGGFAYTRTEVPSWLSFSAGAGNLGAGVSETLTVSADAANLEAGNYSALFVLGSNAEGQPQEVTVNLTVLGAPAIDVDVAALDFGNTYIGESGSRDIMISNTGNGPLTVSGVTSVEDTFVPSSSSLVIHVGETVPVTIEFTPILAQAYSGTLTIQSDDASNASIIIPLSGTGLTPAAISLDKQSLFQSSLLGETTTQTFTIENTGNEDLIWSLDQVPDVVTFTKENYADITVATNQDRISNIVWITRGVNRGIFNAAQEPAYNNDQDVSPLGTQWANRSTADANFPGNYDSWANEVRSPNELPGETWSLYVDDQQQFYDVEWHSWQSQGLGGGFSYTRTAVFNPDLVTAVSFSATSGVVAPGANQIITVTFNPGGDFSGQFELPLQVVSNDPANPRADIPVALAIGGIVINFPIADQLENPGFGSSAIDITGLFTDAQGDDLAISVQSSNEDIVTANLTGNVLTLTEGGAATGTSVISVTADDNKGTTETLYFDFRVNTNPLLSNTIADQTLDVTFGTLDLDLTPVFSDPDSQDALAYSLSNTNDAVITVSETNGLLTLTEQGAGTSTITVTATDDNGLQISDSFEVIVNKFSQTITFNALTDVTYGDGDFSLSGSASSMLTVSYVSSDETVATISGSTVTIVGAGTTTITASQDGDGTYLAAADVMQNLTVNQAALTLTADNRSKMYGETNPTLTLTYSGFQNGDDETSLTTAPTATASADATSAVGTYTITAAGGVDDNYAFSYTDGTLTINQATLTATADDQSKTYGDANPSLTVSYSGFQNGDDETSLTTEPTAATTAQATSAAGTYTITVSGGVADNYTFSYADGTLTVNQATLTATADDQSKTYGGANPSLTVSYSGFQNGDDETSLTTEPTAATTADATSAAGTYTITAAGGVDDNYTFSYTDGTLTVNQATLTATADDQSKTYGGANPSLTVSYSGFQNGDDETSLTTEPTAATTADATSAAGTYKITVSGGVADNYTFSYTDGILTVNQATLTVTADDQIKTYGDANPTLSITYSGFQNGDDETSLTNAPTASTTTDATSAVGAYAITASGGVDDNYAFTYTDGTLTINQATLSITADDQSKDYGAANPALTVTYSGFQNGDDETSLTAAPAASTTADATSAVGTYTITAADGVDDNYTFTYSDGTLTVNKATLSVTADNQSKTYGDANPSLTVSYSGFQNGDDETSLTTVPTAATTADATSAAGTYTITASGGADDNYTFSYTEGILTVNQATLGVTADNQNKMYGETNPTLTLTYSGFQNGDDETSLTTAPTASSSADATSTVGSYAINASGGVDDNYTFSYTDGILTVNKATLTVTADDQSKTYGESNPALSITYSGFQNGDDATILTTVPTATTSADATSGAGTYAITASGGVADNYSFSYMDGTLTVNQATLSVTADNQSKTYGEANPALTITYAGFVNGEDATVLSTSPTASTTATTSSSAGTYTITTSGGSADNYAFNYIHGTLTIEQATLIVTADDQNRLYGSGNPNFTLSYNGFIGSEDENVLDVIPAASTNADATSPVGTYSISVSGRVDDNYVLTFVEGILTISPATLTMMADDQTRAFGEANPELTLTYSGFVNGEDAAVLATTPVVSTSADESSMPGTYDITVFGGEAMNYRLTPVVGTLTVTKANQLITFDALPEMTTNDGTFNLTATATSGLSISYASSDEAVATVDGSSVTIIGAGTTTITASQPGDENFNAAEAVIQPLVIVQSNDTRITSTITIDPITDQTVGHDPITLTATTRPVDAPISWEVVSGPATIDGDILTLGDEAGLIQVRGSIKETAEYKGSEDVIEFALLDPVLITPIIDFILPSEALTSDVLTLTATVDGQGATTVSEAEVIYTVVSGPGEISATNVLSFTSTGRVIVSASLAATAETNAVAGQSSVEVIALYNVTGTIRDENGTSFTDGLVIIGDLNDFTNSETTVINADGTYTFSELRSGDYELFVTPFNIDYVMTFYGDVSPITDPDAIPLGLNITQDLTQIDVTMQLAPQSNIDFLPDDQGGMISFFAQNNLGNGNRIVLGRVENGDPLPNTLVILKTATDEYVAAEVTNDLGLVEFTGLPTGDYKLLVDIPGVGTMSADVAVVEGQQVDVTALIDDTGAAFSVDEVLSTIPDELKKIRVYPNPVQDYFEIRSLQRVEQVQIYDINGRQLQRFEGDRQYNIRTLPEGLYMIRVITNEGTTMKRLMKR